jgi:16S rRNA (adenine1518-N6/adenine1519-N6)-dimethyltransferase
LCRQRAIPLSTQLKNGASSTKNLAQRRDWHKQETGGSFFSRHERTPRRIVELAGLTPDDQVIEVGVGLGALTRPLAETGARVIGLEADSGIIRLHQERQDLPANVELIHADVLKVDFATLRQPGKRLKIVAICPTPSPAPFSFACSTMPS